MFIDAVDAAVRCQEEVLLQKEEMKCLMVWYAQYCGALKSGNSVHALETRCVAIVHRITPTDVVFAQRHGNVLQTRL